MDAVSALASKLSNFTTVVGTLEPLAGRGDVRPGGYIDFELPSESVVNLSSFALHMDVSIDSSGGELTDGTIQQRLPLGEEMIENVQVICGGVRLDGGPHHHGLFKSKRDMLMGVSGDALSRPNICRTTDQIYGRSVSTVEDEARVCLRRFDGFFGAGIVDMSLLPPVTVRVELTKTRVVTSAAGRNTLILFDTGVGGRGEPVSYTHLTLPTKRIV